MGKWRGDYRINWLKHHVSHQKITHSDIVVNDKAILATLLKKQTVEQIQVIHEGVLPKVSEMNDSVMKKTTRSNAVF